MRHGEIIGLLRAFCLGIGPLWLLAYGQLLFRVSAHDFFVAAVHALPAFERLVVQIVAVGFTGSS